MRSWGGAVKWVAILCCLVLVGVYLNSCELSRMVSDPIGTVKRVVQDIGGHIPVDDPKRPLKKQFDENEIYALGATCLVEAAGEVPAVRQEVCVKAMTATLRYHFKYGDSLDSIFRLAKTLYPRERKVPSWWAERMVQFVFRPTILGGYRKAQRVEALKLAKELVERGVPKGWCATNYTRAARETTEWYDEKSEAVKLKETMYQVPEPNPLIKMRLYCPPEDAPKK